MSPLELYHYVAQLLETMPAYVDGQPEGREHQVWQAKALAALELDGIASMRDASEFRHYMETARRGFRTKSGDRLRQSLSNLLARCELRLPPEQRGAFIEVGDNFAAFATLAAVISEAKNDLFVVDPYLSHDAINRFIVAAPQGIAIRLLRRRRSTAAAHASACGRHGCLEHAVRRPPTGNQVGAGPQPP